jgi:hypothetical protein
MNESNLLTEKQAYMAMYEYWKRVYERTLCPDIGAVLSDLSFLPDGGTADPVAWGDWLGCVEMAINEGVDSSLNIE